MTLVWSPDYEDAPAAYIAAVEAADGQGLEEEVKAAYTEFILGCISDGIWDAIKASCILAGARTLEGALVPLVGTAPTKFGTAANWNYNRKDGLQGDGSSNYLNANRNDDADLQDNSHRSVYVHTAHTNPPTYGAYIGNSYTSPLRLSYIVSAYDTNPLGRLITLERSSDGLQQFNLQAAATGFVGTSRDSSSQSKARAAGSTVPFNVTSSPTVSGAANYVFARNVNGVLNSPTNARLAFYSIGSNLDLALLDTRVTDLITAIGAAIP
jgi:hypothetical protein